MKRNNYNQQTKIYKKGGNKKKSPPSKWRSQWETYTIRKPMQSNPSYLSGSVHLQITCSGNNVLMNSWL